MAGNSIQGTLSISTTAAQAQLRAAANAMKAVAEAGKEVTAQQRMAATALSTAANKTVATNKAVQESYAKIAREAIESSNKIVQAEKTAANARRNNTRVATARVNAIDSDSADKQALALLKQETEELRQQAVISQTGDRSRLAALQRETEEARGLLITRKAMTEEARQTAIVQESAARRQSLALRDMLAVQRQAAAVQGNAAGGIGSMGGLGFTGLRYALYDVAQGFQAVGMVATAVSGTILGAAVSWERAFADVQRTMSIKRLDGTILDPAEQSRVAESLKRELVTIAQTKPIDWEEITATAQLGNQLGIAASSLGNFTRTATEFAAVTGVSVDTTATAFGRLNTLVPGVDNNFSGLGDSIAKVGVTSAATESQILKVATQISSVATTAGLSYQEVIGFSGALASIAVPPELSRSVLTRVFGDIGRAVGEGGADLQNFAKISGMSAKEFSEAWKSGNGAEIFQNFLGGIKKAGPEAEGAIRQLGITSVRDVPTLIRLANAMDSTGKAGGLLKESIDNANNAAGELDRQYGIIANTVDSKLKVTMNNLQAVFSGIGSTDLGFLGDVLDSATDALREFFKTLGDNAQFAGFQLPFTNAEALGTAAVVTGIAGALSLMFSVLGRGAANWIAVKEVFGLGKAGAASAATGPIVAMTRAVEDSSGKMMIARDASGNLERSYGTLSGQVVDTNTKFRNFVSQGNLVSRALNGVAGDFRDVTNSIGRSSDQYGRFSNAIVGVQSAVFHASDEIGGLGRSADRTGGVFFTAASMFDDFGNRGVSAGARISGAMDSLRGGIDRTISGIGGLMKSFGPELAIAAIGAIAVTLATLQKQAYGVHTETGEIVNSLNRGQDAAEQLANVKVNNAGWLSALGAIPNNMQNVIGTTEQLGKALDVVGQYGDNTWGDLNQQVLDVGRTFSNSEPTWVSSMQTIDALDDAFGQMADNGNIDGVVTNVARLTQGLDTGQIETFLSRADDLSAALSTKLLSLGLEDTIANRTKLVQGGYNDMLDAAANLVQGTTDSFAEVDADTAAFVSNISEKLGAIIDPTDAYATAVEKTNERAKAAWLESHESVDGFVEGATASLGDFLTELESQVAAQQNFASNIAQVMSKAGPEYAQAAAELPPQIVDQLVKGTDEEFGRWKATVDAGSTDVLGTIASNIASLSPDVTARIGTLGDEASKEFYRRLFTGENINSLMSEFNIAVEVPLSPTVQRNAQVQAENTLDSLASSPRQADYLPYVNNSYAETSAETLRRLADAHDVPYGPNVVGPAKDAVQRALDAIDDMRTANYTPETVAIAQAAVAEALAQLANPNNTPRNAQFEAVMGADHASYTLDQIAATRTAYINAIVNAPSTKTYGLGDGGIRQYMGGNVGAAAAAQGFASGRVPGPRQANKRTDNIPAMLRSREWVIPEESVDKYGPSLLNGIVNRTLDLNAIPHASPTTTRAARSAGAGSTTVVEFSAFDRALLRNYRGDVNVNFAPSDVAKAASTGDKSNFKKGIR